MSNGAANCLLEVCCPPAAAQKKLADKFYALWDASDTNETYAAKCAAYIYQHFDLAERGTLTPLKQSIAKLARENPL